MSAPNHPPHIIKQRGRPDLAYIGDGDIDKVREATDLAELVAERVVLKQKGRELWGCCPLHNEKTPSFKVDPAKQFWHCFGCGEGGDIFGFVMKLDGLSFPEAVRKLAERAGIELTETLEEKRSKGMDSRLREVCAATEEFYHLQLMRGASQGSDAARKYLGSRGLGGPIPKEWMLGYASGGDSLVKELSKKGFTRDEMLGANVAMVGRNGALRDRFFNRAMFPIHDISGACIAFGGRIIGQGEPKYLNSQETRIFHKSNVLYGLDKAKASMASTGTAIVTEGYTDVIAMHKAGFTNTVATLGTALTSRHIRQLIRQAGRRIVYLFDGDEAGQRATERALQFIDETISPETGASKIDIFALSLPGGEDPAEFLDSHGAEELRRLIESAKPLILYGIERRLSRHSTSTPEDRARALADALDVLSPIKDTIIAKDYAVQIADMLGYRQEDVLNRLSSVKAPPKVKEPASPAPAERPRPDVRLTSSEANRRSVERELLALCAQHPVDALANAEAVSSVAWHSEVHGKIAERIFETLMEDLTASMADIVRACEASAPGASGILTGSVSGSDGNPARLIAFMLDELRIEDLEAEIAALKLTLGTVSSAVPSVDDDPDGEGVQNRGESASGDTIFQKMVGLQSQLAELKARHSRDSI